MTVGILVARRIRSSVGDLVVTAETLSGPGDARPATYIPITALARLGQALGAAGELIRERGASLERQVTELRIARSAAEAGNRTKEEFLSLLSHELRTPLNAVYGWASMLRSGQIKAGAAERALGKVLRNPGGKVLRISSPSTVGGLAWPT